MLAMSCLYDRLGQACWKQRIGLNRNLRLKTGQKSMSRWKALHAVACMPCNFGPVVRAIGPLKCCRWLLRHLLGSSCAFGSSVLLLGPAAAIIRPSAAKSHNLNHESNPLLLLQLEVRKAGPCTSIRRRQPCLILACLSNQGQGWPSWDLV